MATAAVLTLLALALWLAAAARWPHTACRRCHDGKLPSPAGLAWRTCPTCAGTGRRRRAAAALAHWLRPRRRR